MPFNPDKPYNDLPLFPPNAELETRAVLRKAIAANKALDRNCREQSRLFPMGCWELIPNQGVVVNAIVLQEAEVSSEIEDVG